MKFNGLEKHFKTENGEIIDFKQCCNLKRSPLLYALASNKTENLNLSNKQFDYLIKNSDLNQVNRYSMNALMLLLLNNSFENLNFNDKQINFIIKNTDLKHVDKNKSSILLYALNFNKEQKINLNNKQWKFLIEKSDISLITENENLIELKKIQSELLNDEILSKIEIKCKENDGKYRKNKKI